MTRRLPRLLSAFALGCAPAAAWAAPPASITLPGDTVFPESVASTLDGTLYIGSFADGGVTKVPPKGTKAEPFIEPGAFDSRSTFGILADEKSGTLWVCSNDVSGFGVPGPSQVKGSALKGFDLKTGKGKVSASLGDGKHLCNDIAIGPDGAAYVTDSLQPHILRLKPGSDTLEVYVDNPKLVPPEKGAGLDGIVFAKDGTIFVDTFNNADLFSVEVKDGKPGQVTKLTPSRKLVLADAMRPLGDGFLLVEGEGRLDKVTISGSDAQITTLKDGLNFPTGVALAGPVAWVSEGQLPYLLKQKQGGPKLPFKLQPVPLETP